MKNLIIFILLFLIVYLFYFIFVINRKNVLKKYTNGKELKYLKSVYKLDYTKINIKELANVIAISNSFILAFTVTVIGYFDKLIIELLVGFLVLIPLIIIIYHIIGKVYSKKQGGKK